jgi:large subunit ribosomal protein L18e
MNFRRGIQLNNKGRTDPKKVTLIRNLKGVAAENRARIWSLLAAELSKSNRQRTIVNLSHLNRISSPGEYLLIPGKVLGAGSLDHNINIAAEAFSLTAQAKIKKAGGQCLTIEELIEKNPKGSQVRIIK